MNFELLTLNLEPLPHPCVDLTPVMSEIYPYLLEPAYKNYIWGGSRIPRIYNRTLPEGIFAESWEVSDRPEGPGTILNGALSGQTLDKAISRHGKSITGTSTTGKSLPLLIKLIDAAQNLSVQVHPHDSNAYLTGGEAKTEMWYVLHAEDDAKIYAGLKPGTNKDVLEKAIASNTLESRLNVFKARKGDIFFIPGGRVHAIGAGCLLLEVQQNSNTTYRVYDWGRVDSKGNSRDLHLAEALQIIKWDDNDSPLQEEHMESSSSDADIFSLLKTEWFSLQRIELRGTLRMDSDTSTFHALFSEAGDFTVRTVNGDTECQMGRSCLIPASLSEWSLVSDSASILCASL